MRLIGLTGGIATGKSTVTAMLADHGVAVIDADVLAREALGPGTRGFDDAVARFGSTILDAAGAIDRGALAAIVFADPELRAALERITHPRINELMRDRIAEALQSAAPLVVVDIPLLFESRREGDFEGTLLVYAPAAAQLQRLRQRNGLDEASAQLRIDAQLPIDSKRERATWVIDNGGGRDVTAAQLDRWWREVASVG